MCCLLITIHSLSAITHPTHLNLQKPSKELVSSPVSVKHRNSIIGNGVNGAMTSGSGGNTNTEAKRRKSVKGTHHHANPRGSIYYQALASDSINEVHPERIPDFIQVFICTHKFAHIFIFLMFLYFIFHSKEKFQEYL